MARKPDMLKDDRTRDLIGICIRDEWRPGETDAELAKQWGTSLNYVQKLRADAMRMIRVAYGDDEEIRTEIATQLRKTYDMAMKEKDAKGAVQALKLKAQIHGTLVHRHEVTEIDARKRALESMDDEQLAQEAEKLRQSIAHQGNGKAPEVH